MKKIKLEIVGLSFSQTQSGAYALVLSEENGKRRLPIIIGAFEAQAIAVELESMTPSRPLTHDLFKNFAVEFNITVNEVVIYDLKEGIFYARLLCAGNGEEKEIDARTSDAIAMAVRFNCPIYTYERVLNQAGIVQEEPGESSKKALPKKGGSEKKSGSENEFATLSTEELKESLMKAIDDEAYETASRIRDELNKRKKSSQ